MHKYINGPWYQYKMRRNEKGPIRQIQLRDKDHNVLATTADSSFSGAPMFNAHHEAVADQIIKCVNIHDELVDLLKVSLEVFEDNCECGKCGPCSIGKDIKAIIKKDGKFQ